MTQRDPQNGDVDDARLLDHRITDPLRLAASGPAAQRGPACLTDDTIAALAEGVITEESRAAALPHLATCAWCRGAVASVTAALRDTDLAREIVAAERPRGRRWLRIAAPVAAAAAVILLVVRTPTIGRPTPEHRAPTGAVGVPVPAGPSGLVARPQVLTWTSVAGADRYRVVLFDASGRVLYEMQRTDTSLTLPDSVALVPGRTYAWKVDARLGVNRWSGSQLIEFTVGESGR